MTSSDKGKGESSAKGKGKREKKGSRSDLEGSLGPDDWFETPYEFPVESKDAFGPLNPLRGYDRMREPWPRCRHGDDCVVQMCDHGKDGSRRFFRCPRGWQSGTEGERGFTVWVDPAPIPPHAAYIYYLQVHIFDLQIELDHLRDQETF